MDHMAAYPHIGWMVSTVLTDNPKEIISLGRAAIESRLEPRMAKTVVRHLMTDQETEKFLTKYTKDRGWSVKEASKRIRRAAATRWAALERWTPKVKKVATKKVKKAKKGVKKSAEVKKAA